MTEVIADILVPPLPKAYAYCVPEQLVHLVKPGFCVSVPLGASLRQGYVVNVRHRKDDEQTVFQLKNIRASPWQFAHFTPELLELFRWMARYYGAHLSEILDAAIPPAQPARIARTLSLVAHQSAIRGKLQQALVDAITNQGGSIEWHELTRRVPHSSTAIKRLLELKMLTVSEQEFRPLPGQDPIPDWAKREVALNDEQLQSLSQVCSSLDEQKFKSFLLHGVTGSGKTEVYIEAARHVLKAGRGVLIIVPEIALTPQLIDRFRARLDEPLAVLHSELPNRERWEAWRLLLEGRVHVALGARSAIFAPVANLALIIVDEEHESSYKQQEGLHYQARDLALVRAKQSRAVAVLGSATPSIESFHNAIEKRYHYLSLGPRQLAQIPSTIECVDLSRLKPWDMVSEHISPLLHQRLKENLERGQQAFILYNRRGFANYLQCDRCGNAVRCPHCSVALTVHRRNNSLLCHYCHYSMARPQECAACPKESSATATAARPGKLIECGAGTERIFEELVKLFPGVNIERLDRDAVVKFSEYKAILERVRSGATQLLVGTQMIAKGHDLPGVNMVGIANCDVGLHVPDFRAGERIFQLLVQASGRVGRHGLQGNVVMQTRSASHPSVRFALTGDYQSFAQHELCNRAELAYPPFSRLLRIVISSTDRELANQQALKIKNLIEATLRTQVHASTKLLGPVAPPLERLRGLWRFHLLLKSKTHQPLLAVQEQLLHAKRAAKNVRVVWDMDPVDML